MLGGKLLVLEEVKAAVGMRLDVEVELLIRYAV
jgi:hypothetical protein